MKAPVALGLGGNLDKPVKTIQNVIDHLHSTGVLTDLLVSRFYRSAPWGGATGNAFINAVVTGTTELTPFELLNRCQEIETNAGRVRTGVMYDARIIDIDILLYDDSIIIDERLTIPHPLLAERRFVLIPLAEIAGEWKVPSLNKTVNVLLQECCDTLSVEWIGDNSESEES